MWYPYIVLQSPSTSAFASAVPSLWLNVLWNSIVCINFDWLHFYDQSCCTLASWLWEFWYTPHGLTFHNIHVLLIVLFCLMNGWICKHMLAWVLHLSVKQIFLVFLKIFSSFLNTGVFVCAGGISFSCSYFKDQSFSFSLFVLCMSAVNYRKKKAVHKTTTTDDKRLQSTLKRIGVNAIPAIEEVNIFKDDVVIQFINPKGKATWLPLALYQLNFDM